MVNNVPHDRTSHSVVAILYLSHCLIIHVQLHVLMYSSWSKSASPITYVHVCVFLCHVKCCSYISHLKKFTLFFPCSCHINSWRFVAAHQEFTSPAPPPNPNNFHTIDLNLLLTLSTILFEIFKMFLPTLMISKINE